MPHGSDRAPRDDSRRSPWPPPCGRRSPGRTPRRAAPRASSPGSTTRVSGLDHVLAMVSVGLWGAQLGAPAVWLLPVTFPMVMAFGGMLGLMGVPLPGVEVGIALSGILLGLAVLSEWRPPLWSAAVIVGFFAIFHGHAHGTELPAGASGLALQHRLRDGDGHAARHRHRHRRHPPLGLGAGGAARGGRPRGLGRRLLPLEGVRVRRSLVRRRSRCAAAAPAAARDRRTPTSSTPASGRSTTGSRTSPSRRRTSCRRSRWRFSPAREARARGGSPCSPCRAPGSWAASSASPCRRSARPRPSRPSPSSRSAGSWRRTRACGRSG